VPTAWPVVAALIGVLGTLLGTFAGSWLMSNRDRKAKDTRSKSVRQMLQTEMQHNLDQLRKWSSGAPFPVQSNHMWESQLEAVPSALTPEEIRIVHRFYYDLYGLKKLADSKSPELESRIRQLLGAGNPL
jgi:hypothetical protein